jgi:TBC1 domain-containing protein 4
LESQVCSLEVSVAIMGHFIASLAETNSSIEIPGEVRRVVTQLTVAECRRNSAGQSLLKSPKQENPLQKAKPFPVSEGTYSSRGNVPNMRTYSGGSEISTKLKGEEEKPREMPYPLKSALSSPNLTTKLSGMSSFFANTHNQIKQQRLNVINSFTEVTDTGTVAAGKNVPADSTSNDNASMEVDITKNCLISDIANYKKSNSVPLATPHSKLKSSQSSFELRAGGTNSKIIETTQCDSSDSGNVTPTSPTAANHIHPLDTCSDVHFTYGGTTKLKTIRPLRAHLSRNSSVDSIPVLKPVGPGGDVNRLSKIINRENESSAAAPIGETKNGLITG